MYAAYNDNAIDGKIPVTKLEEKQGYISRKSYRGLCCMPTELLGSATIRYSDRCYFSNYNPVLFLSRYCGGSSSYNDGAGISTTGLNSSVSGSYSYLTSPLCYFTEDPKIPLSQSIANNS